jgi:hypothetical protein
VSLALTQFATDHQKNALDRMHGTTMGAIDKEMDSRRDQAKMGAQLAAQQASDMRAHNRAMYDAQTAREGMQRKYSVLGSLLNNGTTTIRGGG